MKLLRKLMGKNKRFHTELAERTEAGIIMINQNNNSLKDDLSNYSKDEFEKPSVTVDVAICTIINGMLKVLLVKRKFPPFRDMWALPGGFVDVTKKETLEDTAGMILLKKTNLRDIYFEQLKTYGSPDRDPRMRIITVAYFALIPYERIKEQTITVQNDAKETAWFNIRKLPGELAFDHNQILEDLMIRLSGKISYTPIAFNLVLDNFTWTELQNVYEIVLGAKLITPNFRRKIKDMYKIKELKGKRKSNEPGRPSVYLKFNSMKKLY